MTDDSGVDHNPSGTLCRIADHLSDDDRMAFGVLLRGHRAAARLTQEELAERSGLSIRAVGDMERGRTASPYRHSVARLADAHPLSGHELAQFVLATRAQRVAPSRASRTARPTAAAARTAPFTVVPKQLPTAARDFIGRDAEQTALNSWLAECARTGSVKIAAITGMAGAIPAMQLQYLPRASAAGA